MFFFMCKGKHMMMMFWLWLLVSLNGVISSTLKNEGDISWPNEVNEEISSRSFNNLGHRFAQTPSKDAKALNQQRPPVLLAIGSYPLLEENAESPTMQHQTFIIAPSSGETPAMQSESANVPDIKFPSPEQQNYPQMVPHTTAAPPPEHPQDTNSSVIPSENSPLDNRVQGSASNATIALEPSESSPEVQESPAIGLDHAEVPPSSNVEPSEDVQPVQPTQDVNNGTQEANQTTTMPTPTETTATSTPEPVDLQVALKAVFAATFKLGTLQPKSDKNLLLSPFSLTKSLAQMLIGAGAETRQELLKFLEISEDNDQIHEEIGQILSIVEAHHEGFELTAASVLFIQKNLSLSEQFEDALVNKYKSAIIPLDFQGDDVMAIINHWVYDHTMGKIAAILSRPPFPTTRTLLTNALYFNGAWEKPFNSILTVPGKFQVDANEEIDVQYMQGDTDLPFTRSDILGCSMVGLPYKTGEVVMYAVLPDKPGKEGLYDLTSRLTGNELLSLVSSAKSHPVTMVFPKMSLETSMRLKDPLEHLGVKTLFSPAVANLTSFSPESPFTLDNIIHKVVMDVTETGTEAAAVTSTTIDYINDSVIFRANRPFLFLIMHMKTRVPLFWGSILRPYSQVDYDRG